MSKAQVAEDEVAARGIKKFLCALQLGSVQGRLAEAKTVNTMFVALAFSQHYYWTNSALSPVILPFRCLVFDSLFR